MEFNYNTNRTWNANSNKTINLKYTQQTINLNARPGHSSRATPGLISNPEVKPAALGVPVGSERPCRALKPGPGTIFKVCSMNARDIVFTMLQLVPVGRVTTYSSLARASGLHPRAVGRILASNAMPIIIPCHRVVLSDGRLGGYRWGGSRVKRMLLELEGVRFDDRGRVLSRYIIDIAGILGI